MTPHTGTVLYTNGRVLVLDGTTPPAEALIVRDGRVAGIGSAATMRSLAGAGAKQVNLRGATLMPGFVDTHPHLLHFGAFAYPHVADSAVGAPRQALRVSRSERPRYEPVSTSALPL